MSVEKKLLAISDLHIGYESNWNALKSIASGPQDWMMLGGDLAETSDQLRRIFDLLSSRYEKLIWVPGNHELWTIPTSPLKGEAKYFEMVEVCREFGVHTPEDPFPVLKTGGVSYCIAPMFLLYDYSYRPENVSFENAIAWAAEQDSVCVDEHLLFHEPFFSREDWCAIRCAQTYKKLKSISRENKIILLNHFPLCYDHAYLPLIPRFSLWCGTKRTENWHKEFNVEAVVYGHLHMPSTKWRDGVRFEEVSLGYPRQWNQTRGIDVKVREILPGLKREQLP